MHDMDPFRTVDVPLCRTLRCPRGGLLRLAGPDWCGRAAVCRSLLLASVVGPPHGAPPEAGSRHCLPTAVPPPKWNSASRALLPPRGSAVLQVCRFLGYDIPGVPRDRTARPSLDVVLELRRDRMSGVRQVIDGLTAESLHAQTKPLERPGWPPEGETFPVRECLHVILTEEWEHRLYAERDLAVLAAR